MRFETGARRLKPMCMSAPAMARVNRRSSTTSRAGEVRPLDGVEMFGVASGGVFFAMAPAERSGRCRRGGFRVERGWLL